MHAYCALSVGALSAVEGRRAEEGGRERERGREEKRGEERREGKREERGREATPDVSANHTYKLLTAQVCNMHAYALSCFFKRGGAIGLAATAV